MRRSSSACDVVKTELAAAEIQPASADKAGAEFGRIAEVERLFGLKRGLTYQLINAGRIKSVCLRKPGAQTGVRLVHLDSVRQMLKANLE